MRFSGILWDPPGFSWAPQFFRFPSIYGGVAAQQSAPGLLETRNWRPRPALTEAQRWRKPKNKTPGAPMKGTAGGSMAVTEGFEPSVRGYRTKHFECFTFGRSDTSPLENVTCSPIIYQIPWSARPPGAQAEVDQLNHRHLTATPSTQPPPPHSSPRTPRAGQPTAKHE
jgi:hypothetical protein